MLGFSADTCGRIASFTLLTDLPIVIPRLALFTHVHGCIQKGPVPFTSTFTPARYTLP